MNETKYRCDVLVVGSGGAGISAAASAAESGANVILASKGKIRRCGASLLAGADISADISCCGEDLCRMGLPGNPEDTRGKWYADIIREGVFLGNRELIGLYVETAADRVQELIDNGVKMLNIEDTGREIGVAGSGILDTLWKAAKKYDDRIDVLQDVVLCDLLKDSSRVCGALFLDLNAGKLITVGAGAVVLATGGAHNCYSFNSGSSELCGEGMSAAARAGAELINMEMVTFCPNVINAPEKYRGIILPYIFQCNGIGKNLNKNGEEYLHRHLSPTAVKIALGSEWNKLFLCYAAYKERECGGATEDGSLLYRVGLPGSEERKRLKGLIPHIDQGKFADIMRIHDLNNGLNVFAALHYFDGGIRINAKAETTVPGLYAAGECSGGLFGANRVSAATTEMMVEGHRAGLSAAEFAAAEGRPEWSKKSLEKAENDALNPFSKKKGNMSPSEARKSAVGAITEYAGIVRNREGIEKGLAALAGIDLNDVALPEEGRYPRQWLDYIETRSILHCGKSILNASLLRQESRGVFLRDDYPVTDDENWLCSVTEGTYGLKKEPLPPCDFPAIGGKNDYFDYMEKLLKELSYYGEEA